MTTGVARGIAASVPCLALGFALITLPGCAGQECATSADCSRSEMCINSRCVGPVCTTDDECPGGARCRDGVCRSADAGRTDAGTPLDGSLDAGADGGARDAGSGDASRPEDAAPPDAGSLTDGGLDAGRDAGIDAGPPCECSTGMTQVDDCGTCGRRTTTCDGCNWNAPGPCQDTNARCGGFTSTCRNDYCWGYRFETPAGSGSSICLDFGQDYLPTSSTYGYSDIQVYGRPGATWVKQNRYTSCGSSVFEDAETGALDGSGRDTEVPFYYTETTCDLGTLGRYDTRVRITDLGVTFSLPIVTLNSFNSTCTADRASCSAAASYCSL